MSASSNELMALAESTRGRFESSFAGQLICDASVQLISQCYNVVGISLTGPIEASIASNTAGPSLPHAPSGLAASLPSPKCEGLDACAARHIPGPPSVGDAPPLQPSLPVHPPPATSQAATVASWYPSVDVYPTSPAPVPEPAQPTPSPLNAYPSFMRHFRNSALLAWNMSTPDHESDPNSLPYVSSTAYPASSVSSVSSASSLFMRHSEEPNCVAAVECIREIGATIASAATGVPVEGCRYQCLEDMEQAYIAAHQVSTDCEKRRQVVLKRQRMKLEQETMNMRRKRFAMFEEVFGHDSNAAVVAWLQASPCGHSLCVVRAYANRGHRYSAGQGKGDGGERSG